jgi:protein phosphatase
MADAGIICAEQVDHHPFRHVLGSLLGCHADQLHPVMFKTRLEIRDKLLLCTDGLTRYLSDDAIAAILAWEKPARETCEALISAANDAGGGDNVTVVLASFRPQSTSALRATAAAAAQAE